MEDLGRLNMHPDKKKIFCVDEAANGLTIARDYDHLVEDQNQSCSPYESCKYTYIHMATKKQSPAYHEVISILVHPSTTAETRNPGRQISQNQNRQQQKLLALLIACNLSFCSFFSFSICAQASW